MELKRICHRIPRCCVFLALASLIALAVQGHAEVRPPGPRGNAALGPSMTPAELGTLLSRNFEQRAIEALQRYLPAREFEVSVNVTPSGTALPRTPYEPKEVTNAAIANRTTDELKPYIRQVRVQVALTNRLMGSRKRIDELVSKALGLDARRGDTIGYTSLGIDVEDDAWRKEKSDLRQEMSLLKQENDKLNRELALAESQLKDRDKSIREKEKEIEKAKADNPPPALSDDLRNLAYGVAGGFFLVLIIASLYFGRSVSNTGRNVGGGLTSIAQAFENIGGTLSGTKNGEDGQGGGLQSLEAKLIQEGKGNQNIASLPMESISAHLLKIRNELLENMNEGTESVILRFLTQLCNRPESVGRAVVALELLGRDMATDLFRRMNLKSQEAVLAFLREGTHTKPKVELMLEVGEELKTKLLVESFDKVRGAPSEKVAGRLVQLSDEDMANLGATLDPDLLPRLFLYLTPEKIAYMLATLRRSNPTQFDKAVSGLPRLPDAEKAEQDDDGILRSLDVILDQNKADSQRPFLKVYQEIIERSDDEVGETVIRELSSDPRLSSFLRENIINIHTFFRLTEEARAEMVETLSNREVAALGTGVEEFERERLFEGLPARRSGLVLEEYDTFVSRGGNAAEQVFKKVRDTLVKRLREMKANGSLTAALSTADTPAPEPRALASGSDDGDGGGGFGEGEGEGEAA